MKKKGTKVDDKAPAQIHPVQRPIRRIHRREIKNAPYNPRQIDEGARKKLHDNLKEMGLVSTLTWNSLNGNLVGGHQRLAILDALAGSPNYLLDVSVVELTDKEEKEQNVFLNNESAQGTFEIDGLGKLITEHDVDYQKMGFDDMDLQIRFEDTEYAVTMFDTDDAPKAVRDDLEDLEDIQRMKRERKEHRERDQEANDPEFYAVVVFPDRDAQGKFMERVGGARDDRYVDGVRLHTALEATKPQTRTKGGEQFEAMTFWVAPDQRKVIEDELVRIGALLKGKNIRGRSLEALAVISSQTPVENITGEEPEPTQETPRRKRRKVS